MTRFGRVNKNGVDVGLYGSGDRDNAFPEKLIKSVCYCNPDISETGFNMAKQCIEPKPLAGTGNIG